LPPLCPLSPPLALCFHQLGASFSRMPGVGYPECTYGTPGVGAGPRLHQSPLHRRLRRP
jgi:hypothetical protein